MTPETPATTMVATSMSAQELLSFRAESQSLAQREGWSLVAHVKGNADDLMKSVATNGSTVVLLSSLSALGAEVGTSLLALLARGIEVHSVAEPWLWMHTAGERNLITHLLAWQADREEEGRGRRIREGQRRAATRGSKVGRPRKPVDVQRALALLDAGTTIADTARALGCSRTHLKRALDAQEVLAPFTPPMPMPTFTAYSPVGPLARRVLEIAGDTTNSSP